MSPSLYIILHVIFGLVLFLTSMTLIIQGVSAFLIVTLLLAYPYYHKLMGKLWKGFLGARKSRRVSSPPSYS